MTKQKEKTVPVGREEDDMSASKKMKAMKKKPGKFKPGAKPSEGGRRG